MARTNTELYNLYTENLPGGLSTVPFVGEGDVDWSIGRVTSDGQITSEELEQMVAIGFDSGALLSDTYEKYSGLFDGKWNYWFLIDYFRKVYPEVETDYLKQFAGIYHDKVAKGSFGNIDRASYINFVVDAFDEQIQQLGEVEGGGAGPAFGFLIVIRRNTVGASGVTIEDSLKGLANQENLLGDYHETIEHHFEDTVSGAADAPSQGPGQLDDLLRDNRKIDDRMKASIMSADGTIEGVDDEPSVKKAQAGDLINYAQCAVMHDYVRVSKIEDDYIKKNKGVMPWSGRIIPLWCKKPEKFINYCNYAVSYQDFFKNKTFNSENNFAQDSQDLTHVNTYGQLGLYGTLNFVRRTNSGIQDIPIELNSFRNSTIDFVKLRIANAVEAEITKLGASFRTDASVKNLSSGLFSSYAELSIFLGAPQQSNGFVNLENISVKFDGTNPSTARKDVEVELQFVCDNFETFLTQALNSQKPGGIEITLADLVALPLSDETITKNEIGSYVKSQYSPNYNRLQLILKSQYFKIETSAGADDEPTTETSRSGGKKGSNFEIGSPVKPNQKHKKIIETTNNEGKITKKTVSHELQNFNDLIIDLAVIDHTLERDSSTGYLTYTLNYRGYFDSMLTMPACDALADKEINKNRQSRDKLLRQAARAGCTRDEMREIMQINNNIAEQEKKRSLQSIIRRLIKRDKIYPVDIPSSYIQTFISQGSFPRTGDNIVEIKWDDKFPTEVDPKTLVTDGTSVSSADADLAGDSDVELDAILGSYVFFLGDLLDVISDGIFKEDSDENTDQYSVMNLKFMATNFVIPNLAKEKGSKNDVQRSILSVPLTLDFFISWFNDTVINKNLLYYPIATMIKDLVERVISGLLFETCFSSPEDNPPLFRLMYMTDCRTGNEKISHQWAIKYPDQVYGGQGEGFFLPVETFIKSETEKVRPFNYQNSSVPSDERENYCVIYAMRPLVFNRNATEDIANDQQSFDKYIPVVNYGMKDTTTNYISDVKFSKTNTPGLREARYFSNMNGSLSLLSNVYDLSFTFKNRAGNTLFFPGQIFDFRLNDVGLGSPHTLDSNAYNLGFGGYHIIKSVTYNVNQNSKDFTISIDSKFLDTKAGRELARKRKQDLNRRIEGASSAECAQKIDTAERILNTLKTGGDAADLYLQIEAEQADIEEAQIQELLQENISSEQETEYERDLRTTSEQTDSDILDQFFAVLEVRPADASIVSEELSDGSFAINTGYTSPNDYSIFKISYNPGEVLPEGAEDYEEYYVLQPQTDEFGVVTYYTEKCDDENCSNK